MQTIPGKAGNTFGQTVKPKDEDIRELAEIIYHQRIARGELRTAEEDWLEAESYLSEQV